MSSSKLDALKQHRNDLRLAEVAALLHDVGKFCNLHVETYSEGGSRKWSTRDAYKAVVDSPGAVIRLSKAAANIPKPDVLKASSPKASDFLTQDFKAALEQDVIALFGETYTLVELVMLGTPGFAAQQSRAQLLDGKDGWLPAVLGVCHNEAHHDKQEPARKEGVQTWPRVFASTPFGFEEEIIVVDSSRASLDERLKHLSIPNSALDKRGLLSELAYGLGDTRRPINEITLADWAATVAALYKSALATCVLEGRKRGIRKWKERLIDHDLRWRLLRVNFDVLGLYAKAIKIADLLAYQKAVEHACQAVKQLVEEEYPLGNEVCWDTTGIYFTFPDLDLPPQLAEEIRRHVEQVEPELTPRIAVGTAPGSNATEQLKNLLHYQRGEARKALLYPVDDESNSPYWGGLWNTAADGSEVCPVCRLRPTREGEEACKHCFERRQSRIKSWTDEPSKTIWLDEIADHNDRVALLVGKFDLDDWLSGDLVQTLLVSAKANDHANCIPKNPSPARLRRIWETCQRFWVETCVQEILASITNSMRWIIEVENGLPSASELPQETVCDGSLNGRPVSVWRQGDHLLTISFVKENPEGTLSCGWEVGRKKYKATWSIKKAEPARGGFSQYRPFLSLAASPDQFLAFIPASEALNTAARIRKEYQKQFGKVQNRLPLFLGLVFFHRKMPLMAAMDTARRMLRQVELPEETWQIECSCASADGLARHLRLSRNGERISYDVPVKMGDGKTDDIWYPYFFFKGEPVAPSIRFQHKGTGRWLVHVKYLREGDRVFVTPCRFAYIFLENTAQRFEFNPEKGAILLDEIPRLTQMWKEIREAPEMTNTRLQAIHSLFETKRVAWSVGDDTAGDRNTLRHLVETTLKRNNLKTLISPEDVMHGRFGRCLDLHLKILKLRMQESEYERQPENAIA